VVIGPEFKITEAKNITFTEPATFEGGKTLIDKIGNIASDTYGGFVGGLAAGGAVCALTAGGGCVISPIFP
jgi:hypothetical protein